MSKRPAPDALHIGSRTPAYAWMWENFDAMVIRRGYWIGLAIQFTIDGIITAESDRESVGRAADALRKTYARVKADKAVTQSRTAVRSSEPQIQPQPVMTEAEDDKAGFKFILSRPPKR